MRKKFKITNSKIGLGVFAVNSYKPKELIMKIDGNLVHWRTLLGLVGVIQDNAFRYSADYYLSPSGAGNYINHSCQPNSGVFKVGKDLLLKAIAPIKPGEQITFDYSTIIGNDDSWVMKCQCESKICRKKIKNFGTLPDKVKQEYIALGIVPKYILNT